MTTAPDFDLLALGDVHVHYDLVRRLARREAERAPFAAIMQVGDFSMSTKHGPEDPERVRHLPIVRCHGNHEVFAQLNTLPGTFVPDGSVYTTPQQRLRVLALGGIFVQSLWEGDPKEWHDERRRAFTEREWTLAKSRKDIDILLTHETGDYIKNRWCEGNRGQQLVTAVVDAVRPRVHLSGHHHYLVVTRRGPTVGFMLPIPTSAWVRLHYERGALAAYSVAKLDGKSYVLLAERLPLPVEGETRSGYPGDREYEVSGV